MQKRFEMSLLFSFNCPSVLLYSFREQGEGPLELSGSALAQGSFLIDKFLHPDDLLYFSLYEFTPNLTGAAKNKPRRMTITARNFDNEFLFEGGNPDFGPREFVDEPVLVEPGDSPFPGVTNLYRWSGESILGRSFQVIQLEQDQIFEFSAKVVVIPERSAPGNIVRIFRFDPEMVVGPDEKPHGPPGSR